MMHARFNQHKDKKNISVIILSVAHQFFNLNFLARYILIQIQRHTGEEKCN